MIRFRTKIVYAGILGMTSEPTTTELWLTRADLSE